MSEATQSPETALVHVYQEYVLAAVFGALAVIYAITGWSLTHWTSVGALSLVAAMWVAAGAARRLIAIQRAFIERRATRPGATT